MIGNLYTINGRSLFNKKRNNNLNLYVQYNKFKNNYYVKILNKNNKYIYHKLNTNLNLNSNNIIKLNKAKYRVYLNNNNLMYNPLSRNRYYRHNEHVYPDELYAYRYGYLKPTDLNTLDYLSLYRKKKGGEINY